MRSRSDKRGTSDTVPSWDSATLRDALQTLAAQRGITVVALVQEILHWIFKDEPRQETRRQLIQNGMRFGRGEPGAVLLGAMARAWLTGHSPEPTRTLLGSDVPRGESAAPDH